MLAVLALLAFAFTGKKEVFLNWLSGLNLSRLIVLPAKGKISLKSETGQIRS